MIKILKKQWFVVLIALLFIGFAIFSVYDTNKGKLPGKSVDGKDVVAGLKGDVNITADELYKNCLLYTSMFPSIHSILPFSNTLARLVTRLMMLSLQFCTVE